MHVSAVNQESRLKNNVKASLAVGALATGIQVITLPKEAKEILKVTIKGKDSFINSLTSESSVSAEEVKQFGTEFFPLVKEEAGKIAKGLGSTFAVVAASVLVVRTLLDKYDDYKMKKAQASIKTFDNAENQ